MPDQSNVRTRNLRTLRTSQHTLSNWFRKASVIPPEMEPMNRETGFD